MIEKTKANAGNNIRGISSKSRISGFTPTLLKALGEKTEKEEPDKRSKSEKIGLVIFTATAIVAIAGFAVISTPVSAQPVQEWNLTWGGTGNDYGRATATGDSVYLAGYTYSFGAGGPDAFLNKYDNDGNLIWNVTWGGTSGDMGYATATGDSVYLAGYTDSFGVGGPDAFLVKYSEVAPPPPVPVPEFSPVGLLVLVGILSVVLAVAILRKRKE